MSTPTNGSPFDARVMIEVVSDGVPRRVNVWTRNGEVFISFPPDTTEAQATEIVGKGVGLLRPIDIGLLFRGAGRRRRFIDPD